MGKTKTQKSITPAYPPDIAGLRGSLISQLTGRAFEETPYYSDLSRMVGGLVSSPSQLPRYVSPTIEAMITTGQPFDITKLYQAGLPTYERMLEQAIAQAKEQAGVGGGLRSRAGFEAMGRAAGESAENFMRYLAEQGMRAHEAAMGRELQALPYAFQETAFPTTQAQELARLAGVLEEERYPLLQRALAMATAGVGQPHEQVAYQPTFGFGCCFIFLEGEGKLTGSVRRFRDEHYLGSAVSAGYKLMAGWLVPKMRKSRILKSAVRLLMTKPLGKYADWYYGNNSYGFIFAPFKWFWTKLWDYYGNKFAKTVLGGV